MNMKSKPRKKLSKMLEANSWAEYQEVFDRLSAWELYPVFLEMLDNLDLSALYKSHIHGVGHIERTMLHGAIEAMDNNLDEHDTRLLLWCCAYHDTGRVNDWYDVTHGKRSAKKLKELTDLEGEDLKCAEAAVEAHSMPDWLTDEIIEKYEPKDFAMFRNFSNMMKDADGLDRVRINDLDVNFLRMESTPQYEEFAMYIFKAYNAFKKVRPPVASQARECH